MPGPPAPHPAPLDNHNPNPKTVRENDNTSKVACSKMNGRQGIVCQAGLQLYSSKTGCGSKEQKNYARSTWTGHCQFANVRTVFQRKWKNCIPTAGKTFRRFLSQLGHNFSVTLRRKQKINSCCKYPGKMEKQNQGVIFTPFEPLPANLKLE